MVTAKNAVARAVTIAKAMVATAATMMTKNAMATITPKSVKTAIARVITIAKARRTTRAATRVMAGKAARIAKMTKATRVERAATKAGKAIKVKERNVTNTR